MESKLKALKVVDLRAILAKANVSFPTKANKQDLVARIIASQAATQVYYKLHPDHQLDENVDDSPKPPSVVEQVEPKPVQSNPPLSSVQSTPETPDTTKDSEAEKRRQRAARFGIPVVKPHPTPVARNGAPAASKTPMPAKSLPDDPEKLKSRAARFGTQPVFEASKGQKRSAPPEDVDAEEAEKRRKRAERFGLTSVGSKA